MVAEVNHQLGVRAGVDLGTADDLGKGLDDQDPTGLEVRQEQLHLGEAQLSGGLVALDGGGDLAQEVMNGSGSLPVRTPRPRPRGKGRQQHSRWTVGSVAHGCIPSRLGECVQWRKKGE